MRRISHTVAYVALTSLIALGGFVRLSPNYLDDATQSPYPRDPGDYAFDTGFEVVRTIEGAEEAVFLRLHDIVLATPRTEVFVDDLDELGMIYISRSRVWGFPDHTRMYILRGDPSHLVIRSVAQYGTYDFGVNRRRVQRWLEEADLSPI